MNRGIQLLGYMPHPATHSRLGRARCGTRRNRRNAFTLFELILAIALSAALLSLIATAINLYLTRVDNSRTQVEEAQLARTILAMIADDIRAATVYQPQDTSAIAQLISSGTPFDVDSIDQPGSGSRGGLGTTGTPGTSSGTGSPGSVSSTSSSSGGMSSGDGTESETTMALGLNGTIDELYVDATRLPRREELFATVTGYTNAQPPVQSGAMGTGASASAGGVRPSDLKSVRYFLRPGEPVDPDSPAITSLSSADAQLRTGGLVRQEIPRTMRVWAEQSGNTAILDSGQALLAPEVVHIEFNYFDGSQLAEYWDARERGSALPVAVVIRLWIAPANAKEMPAGGNYSAASLATNAHEYRQTVYLPMSEIASSTASAGSTGAGAAGSGAGSGGGSTFGTSSSGSSSFGGTGFGQQ